MYCGGGFAQGNQRNVALFPSLYVVSAGLNTEQRLPHCAAWIARWFSFVTLVSFLTTALRLLK
jgi:hypothetical protein